MATYEEYCVWASYALTGHGRPSRKKFASLTGDELLDIKSSVDKYKSFSTHDKCYMNARRRELGIGTRRGVNPLVALFVILTTPVWLPLFVAIVFNLAA